MTAGDGATDAHPPSTHGPLPSRTILNNGSVTASDETLPAGPPLFGEGARARHVGRASGPRAHGRQRPGQRLRPPARARHPRQGRTAHHPQPLVVRPARGHPEPPCRPAMRPIPDAVAGRAMLVKALDMYPIECVVRGYLAGSAWAEYQAAAASAASRCPTGCSSATGCRSRSSLPRSRRRWASTTRTSPSSAPRNSSAPVASELRELSLTAYSRAAAIAEARGILLADTKFEFGADRDTGVTHWPTRCSPPTRRRYWDAEDGPPAPAAELRQADRAQLAGGALGQDRARRPAAASTSWSRPPRAIGSSSSA